MLPLIEGLRAHLIVHDDMAKDLFPQIKPIDFQFAVRLALGRVLSDAVETSWSDALVNAAGDIKPYSFKVEEGMMLERRSLLLDLAPDPVFRAYTGIGGSRGWLYMDWAWALRGWMDKAIGGVGIRRGRRQSRRSALGRVARLLARRNRGKGPAHAPARRDESARAKPGCNLNRRPKRMEKHSSPRRLTLHRVASGDSYIGMQCGPSMPFCSMASSAGWHRAPDC